MRTTSLRVPTSAAVLLGLLLAAPMAFADQKDELYNKGNAAVNNGDTIGARDAFCALAKQDSGYKDAAAQCATYTPLANATLNRYKINFAEGMTALQSGDFSTAEIKFKNVKAGEYADQAKQKLADIPRLKAQAAEAASTANATAAAEQQSKKNLDAATNAWNAGDFNTAKSALAAVTGSHKAEADALLQKIRNYEGKMAEAQSYALNKQYSQAATSFGEAVRMNPSGPGDPLGQVGKMNQLAAQASSQPTNNAANNPPPAKPSQARPQIDVATYIADAQKALAKKDYKRAKSLFTAVLVQDHNNQEAKDGLTEITAKSGPAKASDEDPLLLDIVKTYYAGSYQDAEDRLKVYIYNNQGPKKGLANFYLGASMLTRYYLAGGTDQNLKREAQNKFKAAKDVQGFVAPEKFVSPKIMKAFEEAS